MKSYYDRKHMYNEWKVNKLIAEEKFDNTDLINVEIYKKKRKKRKNSSNFYFKSLSI